MAIEIERKFIFDPEILEGLEGVEIKQGYLQTDKSKTVRVRIVGEKALLTIKGKTHGFSRQEFEYEIPYKDGIKLIDLCDSVISKTRFNLELGKHTWELDHFHGENKGLYLAEIELAHEDEKFTSPYWILEEVSDDSRYFNSYLSQNPFSKW